MQITIEKTETIKFDCDAERQRILSAFENGKQQDTLIEVVNQFERGDLEACAVIMREFTPDDWENLHWTLTGIMEQYIQGTTDNTKATTFRFTHCAL